MSDDASETAGCAACPFKNADRLCMNLEGKHPQNCPTHLHEDVVARAMREYAKPEVRAFALNASLQEAEGYAEREAGYAHVRPVKPRLLPRPGPGIQDLRRLRPDVRAIFPNISCGWCQCGLSPSGPPGAPRIPEPRM